MPRPLERTKVAFVTGAASGIGLAVARALSRDGHALALCDRDGDRLAAAARELGAPVCTFACDVRDGAAMRAAAAGAQAELGPIHALAMVAGVLRPGAILESDDADWDASIAVNATGVWNTARAVLPGMVERRQGALVTVASNAAHTPRMGMGAYAASKAASLMLTRCLGLEVAAHGIRCNAVCPGSTETPMLTALWNEGGSRAQTLTGSLAHHRLGIPLTRIATPEDIAECVAFLLSERARHITLQALTVDGGATL